MLAKKDIIAGLDELGLRKAQVELHASLRSFGQLEGGADTMASALTETVATVLFHTFSWEAVAVAPADDVVERNAYSVNESRSMKERPARVFSPENTPVDRDMGVVPRTLLALPGSRRSGHPLVSWGAWGRDAGYFTSDHAWDQALTPVKRLWERNGIALLIGISLTGCTAMHLAEEMAGRRMFIRWARDESGATRRCRVSGCSDGFDKLLPVLEPVVRKVRVGNCNIIAVPLKELVGRVVEAIRADPEITVCARRCERCLAAVAGGPAE